MHTLATLTCELAEKKEREHHC